MVGFSGGVTSAWCAGWALREYPKDEVILLMHDTKEEHPDTYRFMVEMAAALNHPITEQSDGRSVTEVIEDEGAIPNNMMAFCSRILKTEQRDKAFEILRQQGVTEIINVVGFSKMEWIRVQRASARAEQAGYKVRFPIIENAITKQQAADWCIAHGVRPSSMYLWSDHANCPGCARGGMNYWKAVDANMPEIYEQRMSLEDRYGHTFLKTMPLRDLRNYEPKRKMKRREAIDIGACECGD